MAIGTPIELTGVTPTANCETRRYTAGASLSASKVVQVFSGNTVVTAVASSTDYKLAGVALIGAGLNEYTEVITKGTIITTATLDIGVVYYLYGNTTEQLVGDPDGVANTQYLHRIGYATTANTLVLDMLDLGILGP